jgi:putative NADH-flavin reductase
MKLTIFAATGRIGRLMVEQAVADGHVVTAVARHPETLPAGIRTVRADLSTPDRSTLEASVRGADAVLSGLGPRKRSDAGITSFGTQAIVEAMQASEVRRIVVVSAAPIGTVPSAGQPKPPKHDPGDGFLMRHVFAHIAKTLFREHYADLALMEDLLRESGLDWTIVRPPGLSNGSLTRTYRTAYGQNLRGAFRVPRADVADLMLRVLEQPGTIKEVIGIAS